MDPEQTARIALQLEAAQEEIAELKEVIQQWDEMAGALIEDKEEVDVANNALRAEIDHLENEVAGARTIIQDQYQEILDYRRRLGLHNPEINPNV